MNKHELVEKIGTCWCPGCKNKAFRRIGTTTRKENTCWIYVMLRSRAVCGMKLPEQIDCKRGMCAEFKTK